MGARAIARFVRYSPRKVAQVLDLIRGKRVVEAYRILRFTPRSSAVAVEKVLRSAVANMRLPQEEANLYISKAFVGQGPVLKRIMPRAMGRAAMYKRKMCHIHIEVESLKSTTRR